MPDRQIWFFKFGCWVAFATALVHLVGHVIGPQAPANDTERQLVTLATSYHYQLPGGASRSLMDFMDGFSLMFEVLVAGLGAVGLAVVKRAGQDVPLMLAVARALAVTSAALLVISHVFFFIVPTLFIAMMALCFAFSSVSRT